MTARITLSAAATVFPLCLLLAWLGSGAPEILAAAALAAVLAVGTVLVALVIPWPQIATRPTIRR